MENENIENDPLFKDENEVKVEYKTLSWGKVGDWFKGTLTDAGTKRVKSSYPPYEMQGIYQFKAQGGLFHAIINKKVQETPTVCEKGDFWSIIPKAPVESQLKKAQLGQVIGFRFAEERPAKDPKNNDAKIIKVYLGEMDSEYQGEQLGDQ